MERRFRAKVELRAGGPKQSNSIGTLVGYSAVYNSLSEDLGGFREKLAIGCFDRCLGTNPDVRCLFNHDPNNILGRTRSGTLKLSTDSYGLRMECDLPNTQLGRDLYTSVQRGDISEQSFAFTCDDQDWSNDDNGNIVRTIRHASLLDVSCVTYPAYGAASVQVSSNFNVDDECEGDDEECLEEASRSLARMFPAGVPVEVRSHVPALRKLATPNKNKSFINKMLSL